jgi:choice-of-anchor B domain-containing protein
MNARRQKLVGFTLLALAMALATAGCSDPLSEPLYDRKCTGGKAGPFPCWQMDLAAFLPLEMLNASSLSDIWGWVDPESDREFILVAGLEGTTFVEVTNPIEPTVVGQMGAGGIWIFGQSGWRDIKVVGQHAVVISEARDSGLQIFDLTRLLNPENAPTFFDPDVVYRGGPGAPTATSGLLSTHHPEPTTGHEDERLSSGHNVVANPDTDRAFIVGSNTCGGGLHIVDLSDPLAPIFDGCFDEAGYIHDAQCVTYVGPDSSFVSREICFAFAARMPDEEGEHEYGESRLAIIDVTPGETPTLISETPYPGAAYMHQGWLTEDHANLLSGDELDELVHGHRTRTGVWDLSSLAAPVFTGHFTHETPSTDHNLFIAGNKVFQANYRSGLRVLEYGNLDNMALTEIAYFDTYPFDNEAGFFGAWGVYPFLPSGTFGVSSIDEGLFLLTTELF